MCSLDNWVFTASVRPTNAAVLDVSAKARTNEILCKLKQEQKPQLTSVSPADYPRDENSSSFLDVY